MTRVLLVYPSLYRVTGLPIGLASLAAVLEREGHDVRVFDTAFYRFAADADQDEKRSIRLMSKTIQEDDRLYSDNERSWREDLSDVLGDFRPELLGLSLLEPTWRIGCQIAAAVKEFDPLLPVIAGGVLPTVAPEVVIADSAIDLVCVGEGEQPLLSVCNSLDTPEAMRAIPGIWAKQDGGIHRNPPHRLHDMNGLPHPQLGVFDERHFLKPMQGKLYKMVNIDSSRGCPFQCTFCAAPVLRQYFREHSCGRYFRSLPMSGVIDRIRHQIDEHDPEFVYFSSESFLAISDKEFELFVREYSQIRLPFWFQTRFETITRERLEALKDIGLYWLTVGMEHGNEGFRRRVLKKRFSNEQAIRCVTWMRDLDMGASVNNMMGFPLETRDLIFDTIKINKTLWEINPRIESNVFMFAPWRGCELRELCIHEGLLDEAADIDGNDMSDTPALKFPEDHRRALEGLVRTFNLYVHLPLEDYPEIRQAEQSGELGHKKLLELTQRCATAVRTAHP